MPILQNKKPSKDSQMPKHDNTGPPALPHKPAQSPPVSVSTPPRTELRTRSGRLIKKPARYQ